MQKEKAGIVMKFYRMERWCYTRKLRLLAKIINRYIYLQFNCSIPFTTDIGQNVIFPHGIGIVLHQNSVIGEGTTIYQHVTIGNGMGPKIGKNCIIGTGACVLGDIVIGDNVKIGANAVVLQDIPDNCTVVGVPGRIIKQISEKRDNL